MDQNTVQGVIGDLRAAHDAAINTVLERNAQLRQMISQLQGEVEKLKAGESSEPTKD